MRIMEKDAKRDYREEMQEVMLELKLKTDKFMKKLKEEKGKGKFRHGVVKQIIVNYFLPIIIKKIWEELSSSKRSSQQ